MSDVVFRLVSQSEFSFKHLEEYPVWSEFYDGDEYDEIISWGIDAEWLDEELAKHHNGSDHAMYPLLEMNPFPPRMRIFIQARFRTPSGLNLLGYVINEDASPAICIAYNEDEFSFNRHLVSWAREAEAALLQRLPYPIDTIFPLVYETDFTDAEGNRIKGVFDLDLL